jgi:hypothetical protein
MGYVQFAAWVIYLFLGSFKEIFHKKKNCISFQKAHQFREWLKKTHILFTFFG